MNRLTLLILALLLAAPAQAGPKIPVLIDTDIGSDIDDVFALALAFVSPELEVLGVTTCAGEAEDRAWMVCRMLSHGGLGKVPVAYGRAPQSKSDIDWQIQYRRHPAVIFNRTYRPVKESAVELLAAKLKEQPGKITVIAVGPLTNIARLFKEHPEAKEQMRRLVIMGGSVHVGYEGGKPEPEWNIVSDARAAQEVFASGVPLTVLPLDATASLRLEKKERDRIFGAYTRLTMQVQSLYQLWDKETPILFDPAAVAATFDESFFTFKEMRLEVTDKGMTVPAKGKPNARVALAVDKEKFIAWFTDRLAKSGEPSLPAPAKNLSKLIEQGKFPAKVHVAEDYDTDIEKRWWMSGKAETKDIRPGGVRANRSVVTQDYDDRQGDMKTMYSAVIFNPVPGPPMGKNTRLGFRYKLLGTDKLRVQLYSLTNGYHRYLSLEGLPQNEWRHGTVDMTQMRRPDGSGGPLAEDERIDDIQFYVDPRAEVLIDDVILYDVARDGETRPFPKRVIFTAWFDTGKQGKEWPGDFEIVPDEKPRKWKAAKSVLNKESGEQWIRLGLRGTRKLGEKTELTFRYRLKGADSMTIELGHSKKGMAARTTVKGLKDAGETTVAFERLAADTQIDEVRFVLPRGGELVIDDVLLYEPGR
ncbi:MAG: nucleoside hydrolase [Gemmataceae bacterium]